MEKVEIHDGRFIKKIYPSNMICPFCKAGLVFYVEGDVASFKKCDNCRRIWAIEEKAQKVGSAPKTNSELYRGWSDEQFAEFLNQVETEGRAYGPRGKAQWLSWLKQDTNVPPKKTRRDVFRAMSDSELAEFLAAILDNCFEFGAHGSKCREDCPMYECCNDQPYDNIEEWLKQEV